MKSVPVSPDKALRNARIQLILEVRRSVDLLAALDFAHKNNEFTSFFKLLNDRDKGLIRAARAERLSLRESHRRLAKGDMAPEEEYEVLELKLLRLRGPAMSQSNYQELEKEYRSFLKSESIKRSERVRIVLLQGGAPQ